MRHLRFELGFRGFAAATCLALTASAIMFFSRLLDKRGVQVSVQVAFLGAAAILAGCLMSPTVYPLEYSELIQYLRQQFSESRRPYYNENTQKKQHKCINVNSIDDPKKQIRPIHTKVAFRYRWSTFGWFVAATIGGEASWAASMLTEIFVNSSGALCLHHGASTPFIAFLAWYSMGRKPSRASWMSIILCSTGVSLLVAFGPQSGWNLYLPAIFISVFVAALRFVAVEKLARYDPDLFTPEMLSVARMFFGGLFFIIVFGIYEGIAALIGARELKKAADINGAGLTGWMMLLMLFVLYPSVIFSGNLAIHESGALWTDVIAQSGIPLLLFCDYLIAGDHDSIGELIGISLVLIGSLLVPLFTLYQEWKNDDGYILMDDEDYFL